MEDFREVLHRAWYDNDLDARAAISKDYGLDWRYGVTNHTVETVEEDFEGISDEAYLMTANNVVNQRIRGLFDYQERNKIKDSQFELLESYFERAPKEIEAKNVDFCREFLLYTHILVNQYAFKPKEDIERMISQNEDAKTAESPIMKQFHDLKAKHPDALLLLRVGDFYETYEQDAVEASRILGIALTHRHPTVPYNSPSNAMAGFPFHALDTYLPKLVRAGKRVAICDQLEMPKEKVKRGGITELVTPGIRTQLVETMSDVRNILPHQAMLRDALIERMREAGIKVNTNEAVGERILSEAGVDVRMMGSTTRNRQRNIGESIQDSTITDAQRIIVAAFSGKTDGEKVELQDSSGKKRSIILIQGKDNGIGIKHSVYHHFATRRGVFDVGDVLSIPELVKVGKRQQDGKRISYSAVLNDKKLTLVTERTTDGNEKFVNFYTDKKIEKQRVFKAQKALSGDTDKSAGAANVLNSFAKVQQNSETSKENLENFPEGAKIYRGEEAQRIYGEILESERTSRELVFPAHTGALGIFVEDGKYVAFDNSTNDCWVEDFKNEKVALSWLRGELSAEDAHKLDNIRLMMAPSSLQPIFISNAQRAVERISQERATPDQWMHMIEKNGGIKGGEDRWTGLSDWLKNSQERILTKQQVLEYIAENQIQIEEVHYQAPTAQYHSPKLDIMNEEFQELMGEAEEATGSIYIDDHARWAFEKMFERYGDDFRNATEYVRDDEQGWHIKPSENYDGEGPDFRSAEYYGLERGINSTRLDYTTRGLDNKREIALTVPAVESWNADDSIHFGDAGDGRAVAWVRFGETIGQHEMGEEDIQRRIQAMPSADKWQEVTYYNPKFPIITMFSWLNIFLETNYHNQHNLFH